MVPSRKAAELQAARDEVLKALRDGKAVGATVHSFTWWGRKARNPLHSITLTAAVVDLRGVPLGFYVNDSGNGDYGRFVPLKTFERAWLADDLHRIYRL